MYYNFSYDAFQAAEIIIPGVAGGNTSTTFSFPDLPYLRPANALIKGIEVYTINTITKSPLTGTTLASIANMQTGFLTLYGGLENVKQGNEIIQRVPLFKLNTIQNASTDPFSRSVFCLNSMQVDWTKCNVTFQTAPGNTTNIAVAFGVYFDFINTLPQR